MESLRQLIREIHRRSLWQVLTIYAVASWAVISGVGTLGDALGLPDWFPRLALGLLIVGLPIVLATAFVQEGVSRPAESGVSVETSQVPRKSGLFTWRNAILGGVGAFALWGVVALGWLVFGGRGGDTASASTVETDGERPGIAVLPFENMSGEANDEFFTDGMHEEILTRLSKIGGLRVISRTSVLGYENAPANLREIAQELGVGYIGEGSVRRAQDLVRITVQLIDASTDEHLWAETYDRELSPGAIFDIQSDVAQRIAEALSTELTPGERVLVADRPTENQEAYDAYLLSRNLPREAAVEFLNDALELDPGFVEAWAALANIHIRWWWGGSDRSAARFELARAAVERAQELEPDNASAILALGEFQYYGLEEYVQAGRTYERLIQQDPNNEQAWGELAYVRRRAGDFEGAAEAFTRAEALNPNAFAYRENLGDTYALLGRWDEANAVDERSRRARPIYEGSRWPTQGTILYRQGRVADARDATERAFAAGMQSPLMQRRLVWTYVAERRFEEALEMAREVDYDVAAFSEVFYEPKALLIARLLDFLGRGDEADGFYAQARDVLEARLAEFPDDSRVHGSLGIALAGVGDRNAAIAAAQRGVDVTPLDHDQFLGPLYMEDLARVYLMVGEPGEAMDIVEELARRPGFLTLARLRMEPDWDGLREDPRFRALVGG